MQCTHTRKSLGEVADTQPRDPDGVASEILRGAEAEMQRLVHIPHHRIAEHVVLLREQRRIWTEIHEVARFRGSEVQFWDVDHVRVIEFRLRTNGCC